MALSRSLYHPITLSLLCLLSWACAEADKEDSVVTISPSKQLVNKLITETTSDTYDLFVLKSYNNTQVEYELKKHIATHIGIAGGIPYKVTENDVPGGNQKGHFTLQIKKVTENQILIVEDFLSYEPNGPREDQLSIYIEYTAEISEGSWTKYLAGENIKISIPPTSEKFRNDEILRQKYKDFWEKIRKPGCVFQLRKFEIQEDFSSVQLQRIEKHPHLDMSYNIGTYH